MIKGIFFIKSILSAFYFGRFGKGLWIFDWTAEEIKQHFRELRPEGLIFEVGTKNVKEAEELVRYVKNHM